MQLIDRQNRRENTAIWQAIQADCQSILVDRLGMPFVDARTRRDRFDHDSAIHLVAADPLTGEPLGSVRLLPASGPHLLADSFPMLVEGEVPRGSDVMEVSRFCTSPRLADWEAEDTVRGRLAAALIEYGLIAGVRFYTMVTDTHGLARLLAIGWDVEPMGLPMAIDGALLGALRIDVRPETLLSLRRKFGLPERLLRLDRLEQEPAASCGDFRPCVA